MRSIIVSAIVSYAVLIALFHIIAAAIMLEWVWLYDSIMGRVWLFALGPALTFFVAPAVEFDIRSWVADKTGFYL
ncbi:hypothetical protein [uncultured Sulfitobacter sp.]|uniref:hypothetical protein n=1 Tax=uncultured Sulfitobacter sp. TaxID=191468 RepID=UPI0025975277|nr:hypothetical protein [uncultured Sulfitobacter sp.]